MNNSTNDVKIKVCTKCKNELPATTDYFHRMAKGVYGLKPRCKKCRGEDAKKRNHRTEKERERQRKFREENREWYTNYQREYHLEHREERLRKARERYKANIEYERERGKNYRQTEHGKASSLARAHRRNHKKKKLEHNFTNDQWEKCKKHFNNSCAYCGKTNKLEQEHFVPLNKGGEYTINNIVPSCRFCNASKSDKSFFEWYPTQEYYSEKRENKILRYLNYEGNKQQLALTI